MKKIKRAWDLLSDEERKSLQDETIVFFERALGQEIGILTADLVIDHFLQQSAFTLYNKGIEATRKTLDEHRQNLEIELHLLRHEA